MFKVRVPKYHIGQLLVVSDNGYIRAGFRGVCLDPPPRSHLFYISLPGMSIPQQEQSAGSRLPAHVIHHILDCIPSDARLRGIRAVRLACKAFCQAATPALFRHVTIKSPDDLRLPFLFPDSRGSGRDLVRPTADDDDDVRVRNDPLHYARSVTIRCNLDLTLMGTAQAFIAKLAALDTDASTVHRVFPNATHLWLSPEAVYDYNGRDESSSSVDPGAVLDLLIRPSMILMQPTLHVPADISGRDRSPVEANLEIKRQAWLQADALNGPESRVGEVHVHLYDFSPDVTARLFHILNSWDWLGQIRIAGLPSLVPTSDHQFFGRRMPPPPKERAARSLKAAVQSLLESHILAYDRSVSCPHRRAGVIIEIRGIHGPALDAVVEEAKQGLLRGTEVRGRGCLVDLVQEGDEGWTIRQRLEQRDHDPAKYVEIVGVGPEIVDEEQSDRQEEEWGAQS